MKGLSRDDRRSDDRAGPQRATLQRLWETQFTSNRPPRARWSPVFVSLWALLAMGAAIAGWLTGDAEWALGFVSLGFGLVVATITGMVRDEFARWVGLLNLVALAVMIVGVVILWST